MPLVVTPAFSEKLVLSGSGGVATHADVFQILVKSFAEKKSLSHALQAPKIYSLPQAKQNLYEKGFPAKGFAVKTRLPLSESPHPIGEVQMLQMSKERFKVFVDPRGEGRGEVVKGK